MAEIEARYKPILGIIDGSMTSKYYGVSWFKEKHKWKAAIYINGKHLFLGNYKIEEDAAYAFNYAFKIFCNGKHTIYNHVEIGDIRAFEIEDYITTKLLKAGHIERY